MLPFSTVTPCRRTSSRQARLDLLHAVVDVERGLVDVGADVERDLDLDHAVATTSSSSCRSCWATPLIAFSSGAATVCSSTLGGRARIDRAHRDDRRRDLRVLRDRQHAHRGQTREHDEDRDDGREDRAVDEEAGEHGCLRFRRRGRRRVWGRQVRQAVPRAPDLDRRARPQLRDAVDDHLVAGFEPAVRRSTGSCCRP